MPDSTSVSGDPSRATPEVQKYRPRACQSCARSKMRCVWISEPGAHPCQRCTKIKTPCTLPEINPRRRRGPSTRVGQLEEKIDGIMSLLNASQQIQQSSPSSNGHTPPSSAPTAPAWEHHRNSIHQLLNHSNESQSGIGSGSSENRAYDEHHPDPSTTTPSTATTNLHVNARQIPPTGLVQPSSVAATDHRDHTSGLTGTRAPSSPPPSLFMRPTATGEYVDIVKGFRVTYFEAERHLNLYRTVYVSYFPFVPIPIMMSARELYDHSPFLFRAIIAATAPQSGDAQAEYRIWFREYIAQHVVVNNERKLEVLQAILVHLAWGEFYFMIDSQATNLIQLAVALIIDLGLNRWPVDFSKANFMLLRDAFVSAGNKMPIRKTHSLDEMRAALGVFYVCSLSSTLFRRHNPLPYSSYFQKCSDTLSSSNEFDSDHFLVAVVKIQQLLNRAADIIPSPDDETATRSPYAPYHMALSAVRKELDALVRDQPAEVECNPLFWTHYHATLCRLFEPVIYIRPPSSLPSSSANTIRTGGGAGYNDAGQRTAALWHCLSSARDFFTAYAAIPSQNFNCMPFQNMHIAFCLVTMCKLLFLGQESAVPTYSSSSFNHYNGNHGNGSNFASAGGGGVGVGGGGGGGNSGNSGGGADPDWSASLARESIDFDGICVKIIEAWENAERADATLGRSTRFITPDRTVVAVYKDKIQWMREWYVARTRPRQPHPQDGGMGLGGGSGGGGGLEGNFRQDQSRGPGGMGDRAKDGVPGGRLDGLNGGGGGGTGYQHGEAMDVDYGGNGMHAQAQAQQQQHQMTAMLPGALDDTFWQVMLDWSWNPPMDVMGEVQG